MNIQQRVGRRIREQRQRLQRTLDTVAAAAGIGAPYLSTIERGLKCPTLPTLESLARALGVRPADLLAEDST